jgi:hypothetical protein
LKGHIIWKLLPPDKRGYLRAIVAVFSRPNARLRKDPDPSSFFVKPTADPVLVEKRPRTVSILLGPTGGREGNKD